MISRMQLLEESGPRYGRNLTFPKGHIGGSHVHSVTSFKLEAIMKVLEESGPYYGRNLAFPKLALAGAMCTVSHLLVWKQSCCSPSIPSAW